MALKPQPHLLTAADPARVRDLLEHLLAAFEEYCNAAEIPLPFNDAFMAAHNFHKAIVFDLAERGPLTGEVRRLFLQSAADTFRMAMEADK